MVREAPRRNWKVLTVTVAVPKRGLWVKHRHSNINCIIRMHQEYPATTTDQPQATMNSMQCAVRRPVFHNFKTILASVSIKKQSQRKLIHLLPNHTIQGGLCQTDSQRSPFPQKSQSDFSIHHAVKSYLYLIRITLYPATQGKHHSQSKKNICQPVSTPDLIHLSAPNL